MKTRTGRTIRRGDACIAACGLAALVLLTAVPAHSQNAMAPEHHPAPALASSSSPDEPGFYSEIAQTNAHMHAAMDVVPGHDVDSDFMRMMIPHHQGAVDMARLLLKYGQDEKLRRLAQSIIVEQSQEIAYMRTLLGAPSPETARHEAHR